MKRKLLNVDDARQRAAKHGNGQRGDAQGTHCVEAADGGDDDVAAAQPAVLARLQVRNVLVRDLAHLVVLVDGVEVVHPELCQQAEAADQSADTPCRVRAPGEAEQVDRVAGVVVVAQEAVRFAHVLREA